MKYIQTSDIKGLTTAERVVSLLMMHEPFPETKRAWNERRACFLGAPVEGLLIVVLSMALGLALCFTVFGIMTMPVFIVAGGIAGVVGAASFSRIYNRLREQMKRQGRATPLHDIDADYLLWEEGDELDLPGWDTCYLHSLGSDGRFVVRIESMDGGLRFFNVHSFSNPALIQNLSMQKRKRKKVRQKQKARAKEVAEEIERSGYYKLAAEARKEMA